jgi:hypothetical protein
MHLKKSKSVSFRFTPQFKVLLELAATREQRSQTNLLEFLLTSYCAQQGITTPDAVSDVTSPKNKKVPHE